MKFIKTTLCMAAVMLCTQVMAKDLAEEKEMVCLVQTELALAALKQNKAKGLVTDDIQEMIIFISANRWRSEAEEKFLRKIKVSQVTFQSAENRIEENENLPLGEIVMENIKNGAAVVGNKVLAHRLNQMKKFKCLGNAKETAYEVKN